MPIKFRCPQCRQFLGISRAKAGQAVDCPTCGRTIRVPHADGRVDPLPDPALNLNDAGLAQALDELALIGQVTDDDTPVPAVSPAKSLPVAPAPQVVAVEPARPAVAIEPSAPAAPKPAGASEPLAVSTARPAAARGPVEELADLAGSDHDASSVGSPGASSGGRAAGRRGLSATFWGAVGLAALLAFAVGFVAGRQTAPDRGAAARDSQQAGGTEREAGDPAGAVRRAGSVSPALRGRITWRNDSGESRADRGARVIVLPLTREGEVRLPVAGCRAGDPPADFQVAAAALRVLGGDVAVADDEGNYEIALPRAGAYHVLVLSRYQPRDASDRIEPGLRSVLETWFDRPDQLLGRLRYHFSQTRYKGEGTELRDHLFDRL